MTYRVGVVSYLNAKPLTWALERGEVPGLEPVLDVPSKLSAMLLAGELDAALVSSVVALREPQIQLLPKAGCIAADGAVQSVLLLTSVHIDQIQRVALDASSLTSVALTKVLLKLRWGLQPEYITLPPDPKAMLAQADAALLIGDPGLAQYVTDGHGSALYDVIDLGRAWRDWTDLPFVFAAWSARDGVDLDELAEKLAAARELSLHRIGEIAASAEQRLGLPREVCRHYLEQVISYDLGEREQRGYRLFGQYLKRLESS